MPQRKTDSLDTDGADIVASLLARIDQLLAQIVALNARIAALEGKLGGPPKTPDNSSLPPSRGQKANAEPPAIKPPRKGRPGVTRKLAESPDVARRFYAERCACGAVLGEAGQSLVKEYDHIDIPPIRPVTTRIELFGGTCPCCKARVTAHAPADMPEGTPFGPGITSTIAYLHGCQMVGYKRLTEVCQGLFGLTISQGAIANMLARVGGSGRSAAPQLCTSSSPRLAANACRRRSSPARSPRCGCRTGCPRSAGTPRSTSSASRI
jgi:transposase